ncbi:MAG: enoyl-CoA hydratase/isomerase family protein [Burkholderiaceae bacterium]
MSSPAQVRRERRQHGADRVSAHLCLHSADGQNRLAHATVHALHGALQAAAEDDAVSLVQIEAEGEAFCAGADLHEQAAMDVAAFRRFLEDLTSLYRAIMQCPAPVLARVQGPAVGGGAALALSCDLIVAADAAKFAFPEARLGLAAPGFLLVRLAPPQSAARLALAGRAPDALALQNAGLVSHVVPKASLERECAEFAAAVLRQGTAGLRASKASLAAAAPPPLEAMARHIDIQCDAFIRARAQTRPAVATATKGDA